MQDIKAWMEAVKLKLNEAKTGFTYLEAGNNLTKQPTAQ